LLVSNHRDRFPRWLRWLVRDSEAGRSPGYELESYLFFDGHYCQHLVELGYADTLARKEEIQRFLTGVDRRDWPLREGEPPLTRMEVP
jgi:hypothetical protein